MSCVTCTTPEVTLPVAIALLLGSISYKVKGTHTQTLTYPKPLLRNCPFEGRLGQKLGKMHSVRSDFEPIFNTELRSGFQVM